MPDSIFVLVNSHQHLTSIPLYKMASVQFSILNLIIQFNFYLSPLQEICYIADVMIAANCPDSMQIVISQKVNSSVVLIIILI